MYTKSLSLSSNFRIALREAVKIGLFIILLSVSSKVRFCLPYSPVPVTFQTLVVYLSVLFLGRKALYLQLSYIMLGILGAPVFSAGVGIMYLAGPTGGYILGFLFASLLLVKLVPLRKSLLWFILCFSLADLVILISGLLWIVFITRLSFSKALYIGIMPFIYGDSLKVLLAALIARIFNPLTR